MMELENLETKTSTMIMQATVGGHPLAINIAMDHVNRKIEYHFAYKGAVRIHQIAVPGVFTQTWNMAQIRRWMAANREWLETGAVSQRAAEDAAQAKMQHLAKKRWPWRTNWRKRK